MERILISQYNNAKDINNSIEIDLYDFLRDIKNGRWQDIVLKVRTIKDKKLRQLEKLKCPSVTISGSFKERKDSGLKKHSNYIAIDIDNIENAELVKDQFINDPYLYAAFISISGNGLCLVFKIDGTRHTDAFEGLSVYINETYNQIVDESGKNVSRLRYISYDPSAIIKDKVLTFKKYVKKERKESKKINYAYEKNDFDRIINEMIQRGVNICEDYLDWVKTAFALISQFGEDGRNYFHSLSQLSSKYNASDTDRQYDNCLKAFNSDKGRKVTIATIYSAAKQAGIQLYNDKINAVIRSTSSQIKSGVKNIDNIKKSLQQLDGIDPEYSEPIIQQIIANNIQYNSDNLIDDIIYFLRPYGLRKNVITRNIELKGKPIDDSDINSLFLDIKISYPDASKDLVCSIIFSNRIESYNPIHEFIHRQPDPDVDCPNLNLLLQSIITDTNDYETYVTKWLVSMVASAYGKHSPLVLVFCGEQQGTGKTHWFRYLLPQKLQPLFAESKMDAGKDDEILMTKKLIILDDEYGGKSKKEEKRLKEITSKQWINVREPYGRVSVDLKRLSVFCGTSNNIHILNDPTGNRRILPIHILDIDQQKYNQCDKEALFVELYGLFKVGYDYTILKDEIVHLNANTEDFKQSTPEEELIATKISPEGVMPEWLTITQIVQYLIQETKYTSLSNIKLGIILSKQGYEKKRIKMGGAVITVYKINKTTNGTPTPFA